jgi:hypothetical protein
MVYKEFMETNIKAKTIRRIKYLLRLCIKYMKHRNRKKDTQTVYQQKENRNNAVQTLAMTTPFEIFRFVTLEEAAEYHEQSQTAI